MCPEVRRKNNQSHNPISLLLAGTASGPRGPLGPEETPSSPRQQSLARGGGKAPGNGAETTRPPIG